MAVKGARRCHGKTLRFAGVQMEVLSVRDEGRNPVNEGRGATLARKEGKEVIKRGGKGERED